ncbi:hypothetical protein KKH18_01420, partial [bacterium]|nr:hypothetical protein [bacterium]
VLIVGCDLFNTRDPEPPNTGRGSWEVPRVPQDVLTNLSRAFLEQNAVNYLLSFEQEVFEFIADPEALQQNPSLAGWNYQSEATHINRLLSVGTLPIDSAVSVVFLNSEQTTLGDSAEIIADYSLQAEIALEGAPGPMAGTAYFYLRIGEAGYWEIYRWQDQRTEEKSTWSDIKSLVQ